MESLAFLLLTLLKDMVHQRLYQVRYIQYQENQAVNNLGIHTIHSVRTEITNRSKRKEAKIVASNQLAKDAKTDREVLKRRPMLKRHLLWTVSPD